MLCRQRSRCGAVLCVYERMCVWCISSSPPRRAMPKWRKPSPRCRTRCSCITRAWSTSGTWRAARRGLWCGGELPRVCATKAWACALRARHSSSDLAASAATASAAAHSAEPPPPPSGARAAGDVTSASSSSSRLSSARRAAAASPLPLAPPLPDGTHCQYLRRRLNGSGVWVDVEILGAEPGRTAEDESEWVYTVVYCHPTEVCRRAVLRCRLVVGARVCVLRSLRRARAPTCAGRPACASARPCWRAESAALGRSAAFLTGAVLLLVWGEGRFCCSCR